MNVQPTLQKHFHAFKEKWKALWQPNNFSFEKNDSLMIAKPLLKNLCDVCGCQQLWGEHFSPLLEFLCVRHEMNSFNAHMHEKGERANSSCRYSFNSFRRWSKSISFERLFRVRRWDEGANYDFLDFCGSFLNVIYYFTRWWTAHRVSGMEFVYRLWC